MYASLMDDILSDVDINGNHETTESENNENIQIVQLQQQVVQLNQGKQQ